MLGGPIPLSDLYIQSIPVISHYHHGGDDDDGATNMWNGELHVLTIHDDDGDGYVVGEKTGWIRVESPDGSPSVQFPSSPLYSNQTIGSVNITSDIIPLTPSG